MKWRVGSAAPASVGFALGAVRGGLAARAKWSAVGRGRLVVIVRKTAPNGPSHPA